MICVILYCSSSYHPTRYSHKPPVTLPRKKYTYMMMHDAVGWQQQQNKRPPPQAAAAAEYLRLECNDYPNNVPVPKGTLVELDPSSIPSNLSLIHI